MQTAVLKGPSGTYYTVGKVAEKYTIARTKRRHDTIKIYDDRFLNYLADLIKDRPRHKFDCIVMVTGPRRTGKSMLTKQLTRKVDHEISIDKFSFELEEFNQNLSDNPYADPEKGIFPQIVLDEAGYDLFSQNWMERVQRNLVRKFEVIGVKNQIVFLVLPHRKKLNKSIREEMVHLWIDVQTIEGERGLAVLREARPNIWEEDQFWLPKAGFIFHQMPDDDPLVIAYNEKKRLFVEKASSESLIDEMGSRGQQLIKQRNLAIKVLYRETGKSHAELGRLLDMPASTISSLLRGSKLF